MSTASLLNGFGYVQGGSQDPNPDDNIAAIKFISEGASLISLDKEGEPSNISLEYSYDGVDWSIWNLNALKINSGDILYIRGNNPSRFSSNPLAYYRFIIEGDDVSYSVNIMSLIDYKNLPDVIPCEYCFYGLFENCDALTTAPELPATELAEGCYYRMFNNCISLKTAPELPVKAMTDFCYSYMFSGCSFLTIEPNELADNNYPTFQGCTMLKDNKWTEF